jgi:hypothetical protein
VLGQVGVVDATHEPNILWTVVAPQTEGVPMVELEMLAFWASSALLIHVAASACVALVHRPPDGGRDVARGRGRRGLRESLPGSRRLGEAPGFEPFELLGDGLLDERSQVAVRYLCAHQRPESGQFVLQLGAGRELNPVPAGSQGLHDGPLGRGRSRRSSNSFRTEFRAADGAPVQAPFGLRRGVQTEFDGRCHCVRTR